MLKNTNLKPDVCNTFTVINTAGVSAQCPSTSCTTVPPFMIFRFVHLTKIGFKSSTFFFYFIPSAFAQRHCIPILNLFSYLSLGLPSSFSFQAFLTTILCTCMRFSSLPRVQLLGLSNKDKITVSIQRMNLICCL